jgi:hypothetical protein
MDRWSFNKNCIDLSIDLITFYRNSISIATLVYLIKFRKAWLGGVEVSLSQNQKKYTTKREGKYREGATHRFVQVTKCTVHNNT